MEYQQVNPYHTITLHHVTVASFNRIMPPRRSSKGKSPYMAFRASTLPQTPLQLLLLFSKPTKKSKEKRRKGDCRLRGVAYNLLLLRHIGP